MRAEFDEFDGRYDELVERSIAFAGRSHEFYVRAKTDCLLALIRRYLGEPSRQRVLDVGCGAGLSHRYLDDVDRLHGVDSSRLMIERAQRSNPRVDYHVADAAHLPFETGAFDVAFAIGLLHHLEPEVRPACVEELHRILRPAGIAVIFEHNPLNPLTRLAVYRCEFDADVSLLSRGETGQRLRLAGFDIVDERYILLTPWAGGTARRLEQPLGRLPLGAQYYVVGQA